MIICEAVFHTVLGSRNDVAWNQDQLSLSYGGLGLYSLTTHSCAAYIASLHSSGLCAVESPHLINAVAKFNSQVSTSDLVTVESLTANPESCQESWKIKCFILC